MRLVVDAQLLPAMARLLCAHGHIAEHVADIGLSEADDSSTSHYALQHEAAIITKDEDFPHRLRQTAIAPVIVWLRIGNTSRRALLQWFEPLIPPIVHLIERGERLIEVR